MRKVSLNKEKEILKVYEDFKKKFNYPPALTYIAERVGVSKDVVKRILKEHKLPLNKIGFSVKVKFLNDLKEELKKEISNAYFNFSSFPIVKVELPCKVLLIDDEHFPFFEVDNFEKILENEKADYLVTSEILDVQTFSSFPKGYFENLEFIEQKVKEWLDFLSAYFKKIIIVMGNNHHLRVYKFLEKLPLEQFLYLRNLFTTYPRCLGENKKIVPILNSFVQIGRAVFCHFDYYSSLPIRTAQGAYDFLRKYADVFNLNLIDSVWVGHTHCLRLDYSTEGILLAEIGCMTKLQPYLFDKGKISYSRKVRWTQGYGVLYLNKDGLTDYSKSTVKFLGYAKI